LKLPLIFAALIACASFSVRAELRVDNAYLPALPPTAMTMAAYLTITNTGDSDRTITGISAELFSMAHLHKTVMEDGISKMGMMHKLIIKPGQTVSMEPGGLHIMLMRPKKGAVAKGEVPITLTFSDGETLSVVAEIRSIN